MKYFLTFICCLTLNIVLGQTTDIIKLSLLKGDGVEMAGYFEKKGNYNKLLREINESMRQLPNSRQTSDHFSLQDFDFYFTPTEKIYSSISKSDLSSNQNLLLSNYLNDVSIIFQAQGNFELAAKFFNRSLKLRENEQGRTSEYYVATLHNIAVLRIEQGRYDAAQDMLNYVVNYYRIKSAVNIEEYRIARNNLAFLQMELGLFDEAFTTLETITYPKEVDLSQVINYTHILINKAISLSLLENYDQAIKTLDMAKEILEINNLDKHKNRQYIDLLKAKIYLQQGKYSLLSQFLDQIFETIESSKSKHDYNELLEFKGDYYYATENFQLALDSYKEVSSYNENTFGANHKKSLALYNKLANTYMRLNQIQQSEEMFRKMIASTIDVVDKYFYAMSEREKSRFWHTIKPLLNDFYIFIQLHHKNNQDLLRIAYDTRIKTKALILSNSKSLREAISNENDDEFTKTYDNWVNIKEQLARLYTTNDKDNDVQLTVNKLEAEAQNLEKMLSRSVLFSSYGVNKASSYDITEKLNSTACAVEIIKVEDRPNSVGGYFALVLSTSGGISYQYLGTQIDLDKKAFIYYNNAIKNKLLDEATYQYFWEPLASHIGEYSTIYLSVDGVFNLINVNTLYNDGKYVIDNINIFYVNNTIELTNDKHSKNSNKLIFFGNPNYSDPSIQPLPGTAIEINRITNGMQPDIYTTYMGNQASKMNVLSIEHPRILHIASHGFFEPNENTNSTYYIDNELINSGLLLTQSTTVNGKINKASKGVLTAFDALNLELQGTELVILSACETGVGNVESGEGVYGLSRSFQVAGADQVIMSLWKVDDNATQELMTEFYNQLEEKPSIAEAFRQAQLKVREDYPSPYYWGAFKIID